VQVIDEKYSGRAASPNIQHHVPLHAPILAIHLATQAEPGTVGVPGSLAHTAVFAIQHHFSGDAAHGQVANELSVVCILHRHSRALKSDRRIVLHIKEICRAKMLIPLGVTGIHTGRFNLDIYLRAGEVLFIEFHAATKVLKFSPHRRHHQVSTSKTDVCMSGIELPTHPMSPFDCLSSHCACFKEGSYSLNILLRCVSLYMQLLRSITAFCCNVNSCINNFHMLY